MSQIESYSILEKINEWKKEEGVVTAAGSGGDLPHTNIPRPSKLIMDFDLDNINNENEN